MATLAMQSGGYDYEFVHTPSDTLICQICHCLSKEPHLSACCGHTFCKSCLEAAKKVTSVTNACPMCRSEEFVTMPNKQADRIIRGLLVYCSNKDEGCEWQGEVNAINGHISSSDGCQFHEVNCPNDCGTGYQRQYLTSHVETECPRRKVNCQYCHDTGEHQFIEGQHKEECPKFPLPCPNNCGVGNIPRDGVREHTNTCPLQLIQCKYHMVGCEVIMTRKDQSKHYKEMMEEHLSLSVTELATTKTLMQKDFREQLLASQLDAQKTIHDLTNKLSTAEKEIVVLQQQIVTLTDNNNKALAEAEIKFQSKVTAATQKSITEVESKLQSLDMMVWNWNGYLENEAAKLLLSNEVLPVVVKMSECTKKKIKCINWYSGSFYTHSNGYKMQLKVIPNGDRHVVGHMSVCLFVMKGPYDEQLEWPVKGNYEVKLLNQNSNNMHYSVTGSIIAISSDKPTAIRNKYASWYSEMFIPHKTLIITTNGFLKDDNMYFCVSKLFK